MPLTPLTTVSLEGDTAAALEAVPPRPGVAQIVGPEGRNLIIGRAANMRRWAASHLGLAKPARKAGRPRTDLRPVATAVRHALTTSPFHQRLVFERLMARHIPPAARRDLKPPVYLHLDPRERFPRVTIRPAGGDPAFLFGPFRDRRVASRARDSLHKLYRLRPCDYVFEPHPSLPLGLGCVYFQVGTCSAPCLSRVSEEAYRALASEAVSFLARPEGRPQEALSWAPPSVSAAGTRALVVEKGKDGLEVYPIRAGAVLEEGSVTTDAFGLPRALASLRWDEPEGTRDDVAWLAAWYRAPTRTGAYLVLEDAGPAKHLVPRILEELRALGATRAAGPRGRHA